VKKLNSKIITNQWDFFGNRTGLWEHLANSDANGNWALLKVIYLLDKREGEQIIIRGKKEKYTF